MKNDMGMLIESFVNYSNKISEQDKLQFMFEHDLLKQPITEDKFDTDKIIKTIKSYLLKGMLPLTILASLTNVGIAQDEASQLLAKAEIGTNINIDVNKNETDKLESFTGIEDLKQQIQSEDFNSLRSQILKLGGVPYGIVEKNGKKYYAFVSIGKSSSMDTAKRMADVDCNGKISTFLKSTTISPFELGITTTHLGTIKDDNNLFFVALVKLLPIDKVDSNININ